MAAPIERVERMTNPNEFIIMALERTENIKAITFLLSKYCGGAHTFDKSENRERVSFRTGLCSGDSLEVLKTFIDSDGWLRINGVTKEFVFADVTLYSDALTNDDLAKVRHALAEDISLPF